MKKEGRKSDVISFTGTDNASAMKEKPRKQRDYSESLLLPPRYMIMMVVIMAMVSWAVVYSRHNPDKSYSIDNPATTHYYDLYYTEAGGDDAEQLLCTELAAEGACTFESDRIYRVSFKLPDVLREEARQGGDWQVKVNYTATATDAAPHIWVRVYNAETGNLYIAQSGFNLAEDVVAIQPKLVLLPEANHGLCMEERLHEDFASMDTISFMLETSSEPRARISSASGKSVYQWQIIAESLL